MGQGTDEATLIEQTVHLKAFVAGCYCMLAVGIMPSRIAYPNEPAWSAFALLMAFWSQTQHSRLAVVFNYHTLFMKSVN